MPFLCICASSSLNALCLWSGKENFLSCVTKQTYAYMVSCCFVTEGNVKQCLNLLPVNSKTAIRLNGITVKTALSHPHAAGFQQFK